MGTDMVDVGVGRALGSAYAPWQWPCIEMVQGLITLDVPPGRRVIPTLTTQLKHVAVGAISLMQKNQSWMLTHEMGGMDR